MLRGFSYFSDLAPSLLLRRLPFGPVFFCDTAHISRASVALVPSKAIFLQKYSPATRTNAQGRRTGRRNKCEGTRNKHPGPMTKDQGPRTKAFGPRTLGLGIRLLGNHGPRVRNPFYVVRVHFSAEVRTVN